ncbi:hypothetical protein MPTK1_3g14890 [Marchantia polymorpha subsp. ruderalis]|uniref:Uncharacterized protein n=2 Tax=Marchantia polymorpha TaxID=3197 RepID=A0AAF6B0X2_MARPO|nr:hypothetical protein MARPO_0004s0183 [Marchantia polymorpha]BBN05656.1 hypothetical protein Mp_3g14890 [Marchantia polymorpha subsp. ruderalis]|eukprot:PTQ48926.1 hypothetical protein MARPO_0004s0183 [Marchantia polymorpha]
MTECRSASDQDEGGISLCNGAYYRYKYYSITQTGVKFHLCSFPVRRNPRHVKLIQGAESLNIWIATFHLALVRKRV